MKAETKQRLIYVAGDFLATSLAWFLFNVVRYNQLIGLQTIFFPSLRAFYEVKPVIYGQLFFPLLMMGLYILSGYYNNPLFRSRLDELLTTVSTAVLGSVIIYFIAIVDDPIPDRASNLELLGMLFGLLFGVVYAVRLIITTLSMRKIHSGLYSRPIVVIGLNQQARELRRRMERKKGRGDRIVGYVATDDVTPSDSTFDGLPVLRLRDLERAKTDMNLQGILIPEGETADDKVDFSSLLNQLYPLEVPILISPTSLQLVSALRRNGDVAGEPLINICAAGMPDSTKNLKRFGDIIVSAVALVVLAPVYLIIALLIKTDSQGSVFYHQERIGYHKKRFRIIKFRTMQRDAETAGPQLSSDADPRITRIGHYLRKYRLDELPQFLNVLKGEMSLVGPRPEREFFIRQILKKAPYYTLLHQVRPGLTSWGMVKHGYASTIDEMIERSRFDLIYLENITLMVDLKILLYTINTVVTGKGV